MDGKRRRKAYHTEAYLYSPSRGIADVPKIGDMIPEDTEPRGEDGPLEDDADSADVEECDCLRGRSGGEYLRGDIGGSSNESRVRWS